MSDTPRNHKDSYRGISTFFIFLYSRNDIDDPAIGPSTAKTPRNDVDGPQTGPSTSFANGETAERERGEKDGGKEDVVRTEKGWREGEDGVGADGGGESGKEEGAKGNAGRKEEGVQGGGERGQREWKKGWREGQKGKKKVPGDEPAALFEIR